MDGVTTIFCEACVDEVFKGNRPNTHFSKKGWTNIIVNFEKKTGKEYPRVKYKQKWDSLKNDWVLWNKLKGSETRLGCDAAKGTIAAIDEWWERKLMEVPEAAKFREKGLENIDLLDIMFKDITATGDLAWASSSGVLSDDLETPKEVEPSSTIRNIMERVCTLDGIEKGFELYLMAARIF
ncbi:hypothetical protein ACB092_08G112300 [Castanea dentata]